MSYFVSAAIALASVIFIVALFWPQKKSHVCSFVPTHVQHGQTINGGACTVILLNCTCGRFVTEVISGNWTAEQVQGPKSLEQSDAEFLKAMKVKL